MTPIGWRLSPAASILSVMAAGAIVSTLLWFVIRERETAYRRSSFEELAGDYRQALQGSVDLHLEVLRSVERLFAASREVELEEFRAFTARDLIRYPAIELLAWAPRVPADERAAFERLLPITDPAGGSSGNIVERDASGLLTRARARDVHFPVHLVAPERLAEDLVGLDLASRADLRATSESARDQGEID